MSSLATRETHDRVPDSATNEGQREDERLALRMNGADETQAVLYPVGFPDYFVWNQRPGGGPCRPETAGQG
jgi:hypothetical protein